MDAPTHSVTNFRLAGTLPMTVLHLVGRITDAVFSFLGPATAALAGQGCAQTVVFIDDPKHRHLLEKFHQAVRLVPVRAELAHGHQLKTLLAAYCESARVQPPALAHLHGVASSVLAHVAARRHGVDIPTCFTPHGSKTLAALRGLSAALPWKLNPLKPWSGRVGHDAIASNGHDAESVRHLTRDVVHLVESPVHPAFFSVRAQPTAEPLVASGCRSPNLAGGAMLAQCAVLLAHQTPALGFAWAGSADDATLAKLRTAQVALPQHAEDDDATRAKRLAEAWVFLAPAGSRGFPVDLAEAMALGLPCVAWDTPYHRDLVRHDETGLLCSNVDDVLAALAALLDSTALRQRLGAAARLQAQQRFDDSRFSQALLAVYASLALPRHKLGQQARHEGHDRHDRRDGPDEHTPVRTRR